MDLSNHSIGSFTMSDTYDEEDNRGEALGGDGDVIERMNYACLIETMNSEYVNDTYAVYYGDLVFVRCESTEYKSFAPSCLFIGDNDTLADAFLIKTVDVNNLNEEDFAEHARNLRNEAFVRLWSSAKIRAVYGLNLIKKFYFTKFLKKNQRFREKQQSGRGVLYIVLDVGALHRIDLINHDYLQNHNSRGERGVVVINGETYVRRKMDVKRKECLYCGRIMNRRFLIKALVLLLENQYANGYTTTHDMLDDLHVHVTLQPNEIDDVLRFSRFSSFRVHILQGIINEILLMMTAAHSGMMNSFEFGNITVRVFRGETRCNDDTRSHDSLLKFYLAYNPNNLPLMLVPIEYKICPSSFFKEDGTNPLLNIRRSDVDYKSPLYFTDASFIGFNSKSFKCCWIYDREYKSDGNIVAGNVLEIENDSKVIEFSLEIMDDDDNLFDNMF